MTIVYRAGAENANADGLSRQVWLDTKEEDCSNSTSPPVLVKGGSSVIGDVTVSPSLRKEKQGHKMEATPTSTMRQCLPNNTGWTELWAWPHSLSSVAFS